MIDSERFSPKWDLKLAQQWCDLIASRMNEVSPPSVKYAIEAKQGEEGVELVLDRQHHGVVEKTRISRDFFLSPEFTLVGKLSDKLHGLIREGGHVVRGQARSEVGSFAQAYDWLMQESRKGHAIQRFKGLGEMNPEQLWDTTMNPETRRLLQVTIEDAIAADEIFSTLMGDDVEPRREFIEKNALDVSNLDI